MLYFHIIERALLPFQIYHITGAITPRAHYLALIRFTTATYYLRRYENVIRILAGDIREFVHKRRFYLALDHHVPGGPIHITTPLHDPYHPGTEPDLEGMYLGRQP